MKTRDLARQEMGRESVPGRFDFGLTDAQEERAARLHRESIVFDMLSMYAGSNVFAAYPDALWHDFQARMQLATERSELFVNAVSWPFDMALEGKSDLIREWFLQSGLTCGAYDVDLASFEGGDPLEHDWDARLRRWTRLPWLRLARSARDIREAKRDGVVALYANYQPMIPLARSLRSVDQAYERGLRSLMLTYNRMDHVGFGCMERVDGGLSMFGVDLVGHCNDIGIIVDVSHCGRLTTLDACRHSKKPVSANHTGAHLLYDHPRAKTDEALRAIAGTGGIVGIYAVPYFISPREDTSIEHFLDHLDYIANVIGWRHVGIGTDWPLQAPDSVLRATFGDPAHTRQFGGSPGRFRRDVTQRTIGLEDIRDLPNITRGLVQRGYGDEEIRGILGENALRVFEEVCG